MCGIVGVTGSRDAAHFILGGLKKLEYRGYDSAGLATTDLAGQPVLIRRVGRIANLAAAIPSDLRGSCAIGHTRWATSGAPSVENAHPHVSADGRFALVHNGVLTNTTELQAQYLADVEMKSETDTEVAVQLVARWVSEGDTPYAAFRRMCREVAGTYAFAMIDWEDPETLYAAREQSPLLIARGDGWNGLGSDALALLDQTTTFTNLDDGEIAVLTPDAVTIEDAAGHNVPATTFTVDTTLGDGTLGTYPHYMLKEIEEQPAVIRRLLSTYLDEQGNVVVPDEVLNLLDGADELNIVAAGTSYHAGLAAAPMFESLAHLPVRVHVASEYAYAQPILRDHPVFLFLSQSGETADSRRVLSWVREQGYPSLTLTNVPTATLAREADVALDLVAGPEIAVASTKAYTAQVALCLLLAQALGRRRQMTQAQSLDVRSALTELAAGQEQLIAQRQHVFDIAETVFDGRRNAFFIGRGQDYPLALEAALKLKEVSYIQTEGFAAGELKHGTIALIESGTPVIVLLTSAQTAALTRANGLETAARGARAVTIAAAELAREGDALVLPQVHPMLGALLAIIPCQQLAYAASLARGLDVDRPRNLAKSVTVE